MGSHHHGVQIGKTEIIPDPPLSPVKMINLDDNSKKVRKKSFIAKGKSVFKKIGVGKEGGGTSPSK